MSDELKPKQGETSAEFKARIEAKVAEKNQIKDSGLPLTGQLAAEINAQATNPTTNGSQPSGQVKPQPETPAATRVESPNATQGNDVVLKDWAKKKGINWNTSDDVLAELRKKDQEFHRQQAEKRASGGANGQPVYPQPPAAPAYPVGVPQPPAPPPFVPGSLPTAVIQNLARQYNMSPEDVERLMNFNRDFFAVSIQGYEAKVQERFESMRKENEKNTVFRELSSDPLFRRLDVAQEFHNVLDQMQSADPHSFEQDPAQYRRAYDKALQNIGRRSLEGNQLVEGVSPTPRPAYPPNTPPRPLGTGSGGGYAENEGSIGEEFFKLTTPEAKRAYLEKMGLVSQY